MKKLAGILILLSVLMLWGLTSHAASTLTIISPEPDVYSWTEDIVIEWNDVTGATGYYVTILNVDTNTAYVRNYYTEDTYLEADSYIENEIALLKIWVGATKKPEMSPPSIFTEDYIFINISHAPDVTNGFAENITQTSVVLEMSVDSDYGQKILDSGFYIGTRSSKSYMDQYSFFDYSTSYNPTTKGTKYMTVTGLEPGTKYYYRAYAENAAGEKYTGYKSFTTEKGKLADPVITSPSQSGSYFTGDSIRLKWTSVSGAEGYTYHVKQLSGDPVYGSTEEDFVNEWKKSVSSSRLYFDLSADEVIGGYWYKFSVEAYADDMDSGWSEHLYVYVEEGTLANPTIGYPGNYDHIRGYQDIPFDWNSVSGAEGYRFWLKRLKGEPNPASDMEDAYQTWPGDYTDGKTSFTLPAEDALSGYWYKFAVEAYAEGMKSGWSDYVYCYLDEFTLAAPVVYVSAANGEAENGETIEMTWNMVGDAEGYRCTVEKFPGTDSPPFDDGEALDSWSDTLSQGETEFTLDGSYVVGGHWYRFSVKAFAEGTDDVYSEPVYVYAKEGTLDSPVVSFPVNTVRYKGYRDIEFDWENVTGAEEYHYRILRLINMPDRNDNSEPYHVYWEDDLPSSVTSYTLNAEDFIPGYWYKFVVASKAEGMKSGWSEWVYCYAEDAYVEKPEILTPVCWDDAKEGTNIYVSWNDAGGAEEYALHVKQLSGKPDSGSDNEPAVNGWVYKMGTDTEHTFDASLVKAGYWYKFVVEAKSSQAVSGWSDYVYVYVQEKGRLSSPIITSPSEKTDYRAGESIQFIWSKVENAVNYTFYVQQLAGQPSLSGSEDVVFEWSDTTGAANRMFTLEGENVKECTWYRFFVEAKAEGYESGWSEYVSIYIPENEDWIHYVLGDKVICISEEAYLGNELLRTFDASGSKLETIGARAFLNCTNLTSVYLPESVYDIAPDAFEGCGNIKLHVIAGSFAESYAISNMISHEAHGVQVVSDNIQLSRTFWDIAYSDSAEAIVKVFSTNNWTAASDSTWLKLSAVSGTNGAEIMLTADENKTGQVRYAEVWFTCGEAAAQLSVSQNAFSSKVCALEVNPNYWQATAECPSREIVVTNDADFTVSSNKAWLTYTVINGSVKASVSAAALESANSGALTITCSDCGGVRTVIVETDGVSGIKVNAPENVKASPNEPHAVTVSWSPVAGASYILERSDDGGASFFKIASVSEGVTSYTDAFEIWSRISYTYRVRAVKDGNMSAYSSLASAVTPAEAVLSFTGAVGAVGNGGRAYMEDIPSVSWTTVDSAAYYKLTVKNDTAGVYVDSLSSTNVGNISAYSLEGKLREGCSYKVWVGAYNAYDRIVGQSAVWSFTIIDVTQAPPPEIVINSMTKAWVRNSGNAYFGVTFTSKNAHLIVFEFEGLEVYEKWDKETQNAALGARSVWEYDGPSIGENYDYNSTTYTAYFYPVSGTPDGEYKINVRAYGEGGEAIAPAPAYINLFALSEEELSDYHYKYTEGNLNVTVGKNRGYMNKFIADNINSNRWQTELAGGRAVILMFEGCGSNAAANKRSNAACIVIRNVNGKPTIVFQNAGSSTLPDAMTKSRDGGMLHSVDGTYTAYKIMHSSTSWHGYAALHIDPYVYRFKPDGTDTQKFCCGDQINIHHRYWDGLWNGTGNGAGNSEGCITITQNFYAASRYNCTQLVHTNHSSCSDAQKKKYASAPADYKDYIQFLHAVNAMPADEIDLNQSITGVYTGSALGDAVGIMVIDRTTAYSYLAAIGYSETRIEKIMGSSYINRNSWSN